MMEVHKKFDNYQLIREFWKYGRAFRKFYYIAFVLMFVTLIFDLSKPFLLKQGLDSIAPPSDLAILKHTALLFLGVIFGEYIARSTFGYLISVAFLKTITNIRQALFEHVLSLKMDYFNRHPIGSTLTRTINDTESLSETLRAGIVTVIVDILTIIGILFVMARINLQMTPIIIITAPIVLLLVRWFGRQLKACYIRVRSLLAKSNGYMAERIAGVEVVQLFNYQQQSEKEYQKINYEYRQATIWSNIYDAGLYAVIDGIAAIVTAGVLYWGFGMQFGLVEISVIIVYIDLVERIFIPIRNLSGKFATIQQGFAALERIFTMMYIHEHIISGEQKLTTQELHIEFSKVSFRYQADGPQVLKDISFTVNSGEVVALVGATGSGKSTIGRLLMRSYDGYEGNIYVNNIELNDIELHNLRTQVAVIHQDVALFPGTIRENITLNNPKITEDDIEKAIHISRVSKLLENFPQGLDFIIKENGSNLSAGQGQLIVFARAMAHNTPIVLMDEATSNIDSLTEGWIQEALDEIFQCKTVIVVAHRLSTIAKADNILVISEGSIIENGKHEELLALGGYYAELVKSGEEFAS